MRYASAIGAHSLSGSGAMIATVAQGGATSRQLPRSCGAPGRPQIFPSVVSRSILTPSRPCKRGSAMVAEAQSQAAQPAGARSADDFEGLKGFEDR